MTVTPPVNRLLGYMGVPDAPPPPPPPAGEKEREAYFNGILFKALAVLGQQLDSPHESVRARAAHKIIDLERTKLRHNRRLDGTGAAAVPAPAPAGPAADWRAEAELAPAHAEALRDTLAAGPVAGPAPNEAAAPTPKVPSPAAMKAAYAEADPDFASPFEDDDEMDEEAALAVYTLEMVAQSAEVAAELNTTPGPVVKPLDRSEAGRIVRHLLGMIGERATDVDGDRFRNVIQRYLTRSLARGREPAAV